MLLAPFAMMNLAGAAPGGTPDDQVLRQQAAAWDAAIWRKDQPAIVANIGDGFRHVGGRGEVSTKDRFVAELLDPKLHIDPYTVEDFEVQIFGDTALLTGDTRMTGSYDQKPFKAHYRYVDVYRRRDGRWAVIYIQITELPD